MRKQKEVNEIKCNVHHSIVNYLASQHLIDALNWFRPIVQQFAIHFLALYCLRCYLRLYNYLNVSVKVFPVNHTLLTYSFPGIKHPNDDNTPGLQKVPDTTILWMVFFRLLLLIFCSSAKFITFTWYRKLPVPAPNPLYVTIEELKHALKSKKYIELYHPMR